MAVEKLRCCMGIVIIITGTGIGTKRIPEGATILKMTGETPEVRSDKMKQREERGEREK